MSCQVEQIADCGDILSLGRALFVNEKEDTNWLSQCSVSLSSCGNLLAVAYKNRLCFLTTQWVSLKDSNTYIITWSGTLPAEVTAILTLAIGPSHQSSQNGPDWFCVIVGFNNGGVRFYTNTGHLLLFEKLDDKPVMKISCHTGTYGTLPDDIHILYQSCECIVSGSNLFQTLRNAKSQIARVQAGVQEDFVVDTRSIHIRKWTFSDQECINDASVVGLELKNSYDHLFAASTYGGYDTWYRSIPPINTLILGAGIKPYVGFHYALEGGTTPPLQDVARAVANKIKSALPGWLGGGSTESASPNTEPLVRSEPLSMRTALCDAARAGTQVVVSPDRRLAALADNVGRVAVLDVTRGHLIRLFKGYRDAQCAFVQVFDQDNRKPQLSIIKELRRAIFLIIYNPKKGLIDIRLMQRGNRVAVFTATKNGKLLYNTCGLVGAEKNYTHKKLNLPEFQCVLIDPDGKLKKFNIPFFYALEGEHSDRSKDLYILRELSDYLKKTSDIGDDYNNEIIKKVSCLKTLELKKHCLEVLIRKYEVPLKTVMFCLEIFWDSMADINFNVDEDKIKNYFVNVFLVALFYRRINNDSTEDMQELVTKIYNDHEMKETTEDPPTENKENDSDFHLLEDDNCILERLLILAQEKDYKEHQHSRVTFADNNMGTFKEFASCFSLEEKFKYLSLKPEMSFEKLSNLAAATFKSIFKISELRSLSDFVTESSIDPKDVVKLLIMHIMNMKLEDITIELIERFIAVLFYVCRVSDEAMHIVYNEMSPWWDDIRSVLVEMPCPLRSMMVAMACKAVGRRFETRSSEGDEDAWESVTKENAKWGILIGKLEDISILSIILVFKDTFKDNPLPKLQVSDININLKYIYTRGRGSVTELIAKWLCGMGVLPEAVVANELMEVCADYDTEDDADGSPTYLFIENNRAHVEENPKIFKWLSLLRRQFPFSTSANYILANMTWEYAMSWQKNMQKTDQLMAAVQCLTNIMDLHLQLGLFSLLWSTYIRHTFEASCRLVNKVGRLPKEALCLQDLGLGNTDLVNYLEVTTKYFESFVNCSKKSIHQEKQIIQFEKIWNESILSLVEVAQNMNAVNDDILNLNYQISCTSYYQCHFNFKFSKPLDVLYDVDYHYIFEALTGNVIDRKINMTASDKIRNPRMKFITKVIRSAIDTLTCVSGAGTFNTYDSRECVLWIRNATILAELWSIEEDFVRRQQTIGLYHLGYDELAENLVDLLDQPEVILPSLLAISIQRLKRSLEHAANVPEWIATMPPQLYKRLKTTEQDPSIPAHPSLSTTVTVLRKMYNQIDKKTKDTLSITPEIKLINLIIDSCEVLIRRKL